MAVGSSSSLLVAVIAVVACQRETPANAPASAPESKPAPALTIAATPPPPETATEPVATIVVPGNPVPPSAETVPTGSEPQYRGGVAVACSAADWSARQLKPLLAPGKVKNTSQADRPALRIQPLFGSACTDAPNWPGPPGRGRVTLDGVSVELSGSIAAGQSGRGWLGAQCGFSVWASDTTGKTIRLGPSEIPPFNTINAVLRAGSAVWLSVGFNGYTREFPKGGNRIIALDLCEGRVVWQSKDAMSNGGLLLLDDYLIAPFGFTSERRYVYVLDAHSGSVVQKLPIVENVCPSKSWAPNWHPGERCDAPGQLVGAANSPRVEDGLFLVDTNTGSSSFQIK